MKLSIRFVRTAAALAFSLAGSWACWGQAYPDKPIKLVVGSSAGSSVDLVARAYARFLADDLHQPVVVDNMPGANSEIGHGFVARAKPDGYTIVLFGNNSLLVQLAGRSKVDVERDFAPISTAGTAPWAFSVRANAPFKSIKDVVEFGRREPGKLTFASIGGGIPDYIGGALAQAANIKILPVPYKSTSDAKADVLTGRVDLWFTTASTAVPLHETKMVRILGISGDSAPDGLKDVPTMKEAGYDMLDAESSYFFLAPHGTPRPILEKLNQAITKAQHDPAVLGKLHTQGVDPQISTVDATGQALRTELAKWGQIIKPASN